jgi:hypothetical protein
MPRAPTLLRAAAAAAAAYTTAAAAAGARTLDGCPCVGECARTIDGFLTPWCYTSPSPPEPPPQAYCGKYSSTRRAYWAECAANVTGSGGFVASHPVTTFSELAGVMATSAVALCAALMGAAGVVAAALTSPRRALPWLPCAALALGGCQGVCVGGPIAAILAFLYLSIPYAIDYEVAVGLGVVVGLLAVYASLGRHARAHAAPHACEYE